MNVTMIGTEDEGPCLSVGKFLFDPVLNAALLQHLSI